VIGQAGPDRCKCCGDEWSDPDALLDHWQATVLRGDTEEREGER